MVATVVHTAMEIASAMLCFGISAFAWRRYLAIRSGFNLLWSIAFLAAGLQDAIHGLLSLGDGDLIEYWVPWTWATSRAVLVLCLIAGALSARMRIEMTTARVHAIAVGMIALAFAAPILNADLSFVHTDEMGVVHRPVDAVLAALWAALLVIYSRVHAATIQAPGGFRIFITLGIFAHLVMAFGSRHSLDAAFFLGHALKLLELSFWLLLVWVETTEDPEDYIALIQRKSEEWDDVDTDVIRQLAKEIRDHDVRDDSGPSQDGPSPGDLT